MRCSLFIGRRFCCACEQSSRLPAARQLARFEKRQLKGEAIAAPIAIQNETIRKNAIHYRQIARDFAQTNFPPIRSLATKRFDLNLPRVGARLEAGCDKPWGDREDRKSVV